MLELLELLELLDTGSLLSPQEAFEEDSANIRKLRLRHSPGLRLRLMLLQPEVRVTDRENPP